MDSIPSGPKGPNRSQYSTVPDPQEGSVHEVPVERKQIPSGQPPERKPLDAWDIFPWTGVAPTIAKPAIPPKEQYVGVDVRQRVLAMLDKMEPDLDVGTVRRVSEARKQEMSGRIDKIQQALGKESIQKALANDNLLLDFGDQSPSVDITLNTAMALALKLELAQQKVRAGINADRTNVSAWVSGLIVYGDLQDAWRELHNIVKDICTHEPLVELPVSTPKQRSDSVDSGFGDLMEPWDKPLLLPAPQPASFPPAAEERFRQLEAQVETQKHTLDHIQVERSMTDRLQQSQNTIDQLMRDNQGLTHQNSLLQQQVQALHEQITQQPTNVSPEEIERLKGQITRLSQENIELRDQLEQEKSRFRSRELELTHQKGLVAEKDLLLSRLQTGREEDQRIAESVRLKLTQQISDLESQLSNRDSSLLTNSSRLRELEQANEQLSRQVESQAQDIQSLTSQLSDKDESLSVLSDEISDAKVKIDQLNTVILDFEEREKVAAETMQSSELQYTLLQKENEQLLAQQDVEKALHEEALVPLKESVQRLEREKDDIALAREQASRELADVRLKETDLEQRNHKSIEEKDSRIKELEETIENHQQDDDERIPELNTQLERAKQELKTFKETADFEKDTLKATLEAADVTGKDKIVELLEKIATLEDDIKVKEDEFNHRTQEDDSQHQAALHQVESTVKSLEDQMTQYQQQESAQQLEIEQLNKTLTEKQDELQNEHLRFTSEQGELANEYDQALELKAESLQRLENQLSSLESTHAEELKKWDAEKNGFETRLNEFEVIEADLKQQLEEEGESRKSEVSEIHAKYSDEQSKLLDVKNELDATARSKKSLEDQFQWSQDSVNTLTSELDIEKQKTSQLSEQLKQKEQLLTTNGESAQTSQASLESEKEQLTQGLCSNLNMIFNRPGRSLYRKKSILLHKARNLRVQRKKTES